MCGGAVEDQGRRLHIDDELGGLGGADAGTVAGALGRGGGGAVLAPEALALVFGGEEIHAVRSSITASS